MIGEVVDAVDRQKVSCELKISDGEIGIGGMRIRSNVNTTFGCADVARRAIVPAIPSLMD